MRAAWAWLAPALAVIVYLATLPSTVQTGDTGELVASGYLLKVPHPSGYPLFVWFVYFFTHLIPWGTVFARAAGLNVLLSAGTVALIAFSGKNRILSFSVALVFAFSEIFWRNTVLPDVFAFNNLFVAAIVWLRGTEISSAKKTWLTTLLYFLGLTNHLTLIFLTPVVVEQWLRDRNFKRMFTSVIAGVVLCLGVYGTLMFMHPSDRYSWGDLRSPSSVLRHFLREDYGRAKPVLPAVSPPVIRPVVPAPKNPPVPGAQFKREVESGAQLVAEAPASMEFKYYLLQFFRTTAPDLGPVLGLCLFVLAVAAYRRKRVNAPLILGCAAVYSILVFALLKVKPMPETEEMIERFFLLPQLLLCFFVTENAGLKKEIDAFISGACLVLAVANGVRYFPVLNYSQNTILDDYAANLLAMTPESQHAIVLADDDSVFYALRYRQEIFAERPNVLSVAAPLFFHPWYVEKTQALMPEFVFHGGADHYSLEDDLILPNVAKIPFFVSGQFRDPVHFKMTYLPVGVRLDAGSGIEFDHSQDSKLHFRSTPLILATDPIHFDPYRLYFAQYAIQDLAQGLAASEKKKPVEALAYFYEALKRVPYCIPAKTNVCILEDSDNRMCWEEEVHLKMTNFDYFKARK